MMNEDIQKCAFCGKEFKNKKGLTQHLKDIHRRNAKGELLPMSEEKKNQCVHCEKTFKRKTSLQIHISHVHFKNSCEVLKCTTCKYSTYHKSNLTKHILRCHSNSKPKVTTEKKYKCTDCEASFKYHSGLHRHRRKKHNLKIKNHLMNGRKCPLCSFDTTDPKLKSMYNHFENVHNIVLRWESYSFASFAEFVDWKRGIEKETVSSYILRSKSKMTATFQCHRCGFFKSSGQNKRSIKNTGSCKVNGFCPGSIKLKVRKGCITALYQRTHVGHKNELKYVRLSKEEKRYIASMLLDKVPYEEILRNIRESSTNTDIQRIHLLKKKDIANIEKSFSLNPEEFLNPYGPIESLVINQNKPEDTAPSLDKPQDETNENFPSFDENNFNLVFIREEDSQAEEIVVEEVCREEFYEDCSYSFVETICENDGNDCVETDYENNSNSFEEKKQTLLSELSKLEKLVKKNCATIEQVDFMTETIKQTIEAIKSPNPVQTAAPSNKPGNTVKAKQSHFVAPLENKTEEEIQMPTLVEKQSTSLHRKVDRIQPVNEYSDHVYCLRTAPGK